MFAVEAYFRTLELGLNLTTNEQIRPGGDRIGIKGRAVDPASALVFEIQPDNQLFNNHDGVFWIERIVIEHNLTSTVAVTVDTESGVSIAAGTLAVTPRRYTEFEIQRPGRLKRSVSLVTLPPITASTALNSTCDLST